MSIQRQVGVWLAALAVLIALLVVFSGVLLPFIAGLVLAYLLDPLADRLERAGMGRLAATLLILLLFILVFLLALMIVAPLLASQIGAFLNALPDTFRRLQAILAEKGGPLLRQIGGENVLTEMQGQISGVVGEGSRLAAAFVASLLSGGQALLGVISLLIVTPVVAFYLLLDWDRMIALIDSHIPPRNRPVIHRLAREMDGAIAGFIRGQALVCLLLGLWYAIGLWMIGVNFGILIGIVAGFISFIPYVGTIAGFVLAVSVALAQFLPEFVPVILVVVVFATGQFMEGNILSPKLVGDSVGLHPVWLMFSLFAFGSLFGFVGLLLAVPLAAIVGVLVRFAAAQYRASALYHGGAPRPAGAETDDG
jgi:predicted PurR-regulated permease PerM